eukprot:TRINITY_DN18735_c0_g1_i1.p1 TRINITY_DN18735_c0_g1~~TRINITY_DN18735_c0_g1_i1.p1  ORF type:complete len:350 (+),score=28.24 TRINITY_DN18735_c0_g1_i1:41-1051(+)
MALPADYWKNDRCMSLFRTRVCTRLKKQGMCQWRAQCQFSHCLTWPKRALSPGRCVYSPQLCTKVSVKDGKLVIDCTKRNDCNHAHTKEEVLYHPAVFKTLPCEDHERDDVTCHRFYCPFAHGAEELQRPRNSSPSQSRSFIEAVRHLPSDDCCELCPPSYDAEAVWPQDMVGINHVPGLGYMQHGYAVNARHSNATGQWGYTNDLSYSVTGMHTADHWDYASNVADRVDWHDGIDSFGSLPANTPTPYRIGQDMQNVQDTWGLHGTHDMQCMQGGQTRQDCYFPQASAQLAVTSSYAFQADAASQSTAEDCPSFSDVSALDLLTERLEEILDGSD